MEENKTSITPIVSNQLTRVRKSIEITNKILFGDIENLFNRAFLKMNSKSLLPNKNYLFLFETDPNYQKVNQYLFEANTKDDYRLALNLLNSILEIKHSHRISLELAGICQFKLEKYEDSIQSFSEVTKLNIESTLAYYYRGLARYELGLNKDDQGFCRKANIIWKDAIEDFSKAIEITPKDFHIYLWRGHAMERYSRDSPVKLYENAIKDFSKAIKLNPKSSEAYKGRGESKVWLGDYKGMINDYSIAIELNPKDADAYFSRGINKEDMKGDYIGAIEDYSRAIKINPRLADAYRWRGLARKQVKNYKGAIDDFSILIKLDPKNSWAYLYRGNTRKESKNYNSAIKDYSKAIELNPKNAGAYFWRGQIRKILRDYEGALSDELTYKRLSKK